MADRLTTIRSASLIDVPHLVRLSGEKRASYAQVKPQFWRAATNADEVQVRFFERLVDDPDHEVLVAQDETRDVTGFCVVRMMSVPPVYEPGGHTALLDDFVVAGGDASWQTVGRILLVAARHAAARRGAVQLIVVVGAHDHAKRHAVESEGYSATSIWYTGPIRAID